MVASLGPVNADTRFGEFSERRHRFERVLDAESFIALTRTYPGFHTTKRDDRYRQIIDNEFGGAVTRVEDAVLHLSPATLKHQLPNTRETLISGDGALRRTGTCRSHLPRWVGNGGAGNGRRHSDPAAPRG